MSDTKNQELQSDESEALSLLYRLAGVGISLSAEGDIDSLLERIVMEASSFTNADGVTLYLLRDNQLHFSISHNRSQQIKLGGASGAPITFDPLPVDEAFVSGYAAKHRETVNIKNVYDSEGFDFAGPRNYDEQTGYKSVSLLATPLLNHEYEVIGVLQLLNAIDQTSGEVTYFDHKAETLAECLASQAAVALTGFNLLKETEELFESFLQVMATGLDARSKYTSGHVRRVAGLTLEMALAINETYEGPYASATISENEFDELRIAGWMHDIGKIVSPPHIMDKATKLETIYDRAEHVKTRFELAQTLVEKEFLSQKLLLVEHGADQKDIDLLAKESEKRCLALRADCAFLMECNSAFMTSEKQQRLAEISQKMYLINGEARPILTHDEMKNLSIVRGTLTEEERKIMQDHIVVTIRMLEKIPFPRKFTNAPLYAGSHHETLDGKGYPKGLSAADMPLQSRILCITDFLEALMATDRPYKKSMPLEKAYAILQEEVDKGKLDGALLKIAKDKNIYERFVDKDARGDFAT